MKEKSKVFLWVTLIVAAELTAFALLQDSVDHHAPGKVVVAMLLFGIVVTLSFRESLRGAAIAVSNLYWIILSSLGSVALGYYLYDQKLTSRQYIAVGLLVAATTIQFI
jgi:multidrug transporter EmrE-like cation transporter